MARNFYRIFTENNPVMGDSKTFGILDAKGLKVYLRQFVSSEISPQSLSVSHTQL